MISETWRTVLIIVGIVAIDAVIIGFGIRHQKKHGMIQKEKQT